MAKIIVLAEAVLVIVALDRPCRARFPGCARIPYWATMSESHRVGRNLFGSGLQTSDFGRQETCPEA